MKKKLITGLLCLACLIPASFADTKLPSVYFDDTTSTYGVKDSEGNLLTETTYDGISIFVDGLAIIQKDGKFGVLSITGKELVPPTYKYITDYRGGFATVFLEDLAGVIDTRGQVIIPIEYDNISHFVNGNALAYKKNKLGLLSSKNEVVHPFVWDEATMLDFKKDYTTFVFKQNGQYGIASYSGEIILAPQDKELFHISDDQVAFVEANKIGVMGHDGQVLVPASYESIYIAGKGYMGKKDKLYYFFDLENGHVSQAYDSVEGLNEGRYLIKKGKRMGIYDAYNHREVLAPSYDDLKILQNPHDESQLYYEITRFSTIEEGLAYKGVASLDGEILLPTLYTRLSFLNDNIIVYENSQNTMGTYEIKTGTDSGLTYNSLKYNENVDIAIVSSRDDLYGLIDKNGTLISPMTNDHIYENGNFYVAEKDGKKALFSKRKKTLTPYKYDTIFSFRNIGNAEAAIISINNKWGFITPEGLYLVPPEYDAINEFVNGYAIVSKDGLYGFINTKGELVIKPEFEDVSSFNNGLAIAKKGDYYGFIKTDGRFIIPAIYDHVRPFNDEGQAVVTLKGRMGIINRDRTYFLKPIYDNLTFVEDKIIILQDSATKKFGIIKPTGEEISQAIYDEIGAFFKEEVTYVGFKGKYALINNKGQVLTDFIFDEMTLFNNGFASIKIGDKRGFINSRGDYILE